MVIKARRLRVMTPLLEAVLAKVSRHDAPEPAAAPIGGPATAE